VLTSIIIFEGSFLGPIIYENKGFVSPNVVRSLKRKAEGSRYAGRKEAEKEREQRGKARQAQGDFVCIASFCSAAPKSGRQSRN
jgi:hypothetical protein